MTEAQHQQYLIKWTQQESVRRKYPCLKLLFHIPNERYCTPQQGATLKRMGVKSGVPDMCLPVSRGKYHGLYIEMKNEKGKSSANQKWWIDELLSQDYLAVECKSWKSAAETIESYLESKYE